MSETRVEGTDRVIEEQSLGELVSMATRDVSQLIRSEIELAKAELRNDAKRAGIGAGMFGAAGFFGYVALLFLSVALGLGLAAVGLPAWAAFLIVGGLYLLLAATVGMVGMLNLRRMTKAQRTVRAVRANFDLVKRA